MVITSGVFIGSFENQYPYYRLIFFIKSLLNILCLEQFHECSFYIYQVLFNTVLFHKVRLAMSAFYSENTII